MYTKTLAIIATLVAAIFGAPTDGQSNSAAVAGGGVTTINQANQQCGNNQKLCCCCTDNSASGGLLGVGLLDGLLGGSCNQVPLSCEYCHLPSFRIPGG